MKEKNRKKKKGIANALLNIGIILCAAVFVYSAVHVYKLYSEYRAGEKEYKDIEQMYTKRSDKPDETVSDESVTVETEGNENDYIPLQVDFDALQAVNPDVVGWLEIEALDISYPIVQGEDNTQYLHTTFEKKSNFSGSIFMDCTNSSDFSDCHTIIYGHNMKNQSMFGKLKFIKEKEKYKDSRYFWILTPEANYRYEIISARVTPVDGEVYTWFSEADNDFVEYLYRMAQQSQIPATDTVFDETDRLVTLSTCTSDDQKRFVVQGIRVSG